MHLGEKNKWAKSTVYNYPDNNISTLYYPAILIHRDKKHTPQFNKSSFGRKNLDQEGHGLYTLEEK